MARARIRSMHTYTELEAWLQHPDTRVIDCRMLELSDDFAYELQYLGADEKIHATLLYEINNLHLTPLDLFKLQYRNNPRNNPGLYGLLDGDNDVK